jgi:D-glycero-alpha-D-manno-heptose 1-phosphate guanylyltransferase
MDIIILAGGLGTRLKPVVQDVPKPMAPVGDRPFLQYLFDYLIGQNISDRWLISVGYKYQKIIDYFGDRYRSCHLIYLLENHALGTGGAIKTALSQVTTEHVLILNGDTFFQVDLSEMFHFHLAQNADMTLALKPLVNFNRYHNVLLDENQRVSNFEEKKMKEQGHINGGIYILRKNLLETFQLPETFSFEDDFLKPYVQHLSIYGYISKNYFIDIGIPEDYQKSQIELPSIKLSVPLVHQ